MRFHDLLMSIINSDYASFSEIIEKEPGLVNRFASKAESECLPDPITEGETPLLLASLLGDDRMVKLLIEKDAVVNFHRPNNGETALIVAGFYGRVDIMDRLVRHGARLDDVNHKQETAFLHVFHAYTNGDMPNLPESFFAVKKLVESGANINAQDQDGKTALILAFDRRIDDVLAVQLLLDHGVDVGLKDNFGRTAMDYLEKASESVKEYMASRLDQAHLDDFIGRNDEKLQEMTF